MLNKFSVIYIILATCAALISMVGTITGYWAAGRKDIKQLSPEIRHRFEQHLYLAFSALGLGLFLKLTLVPGWFLMLKSLIPSIPGAMCLIGVHQNVPVFSWLASGLKLALPMLYVTWIVVSLVDHKLQNQPFMKVRSFLLLPLTCIICFEIATDLIFLFSLKPVKVSCCTSILESSANTGHALSLFAYHPFAIVAVLISLSLLIFNYKPPATKAVHFMSSVLSVLLVFFLILVFHFRHTPVQLPAYVSNTIYHYCIFCFMQSNTLGLISFALIFSGCTLSLAVGITHLLGTGKIETEQLGALTRSFRKLTIILIIIGFFFLFFS